MASSPTTRFYIDADILGLAHVLLDVRHEIRGGDDITYPGFAGDPASVRRQFRRLPCPITQTDIDDDEWIRKVASRGWLILPRDSRIQTRFAEKEAIKAAGVNGRMVALVGKEANTKFNQLEIVMTQ